MKNTIFILISLGIQFACAVGNADPLDDHLAKMKSVLEKDDRCEFAVVTIPKDRTRQNVWPRGAVCAGTLVFNKGTMEEKNGCTGFFINANNLMISALQPQLDYNMIAGKKCDAGGFEALMQDLLFTDNTVNPPKKVSVAWSFTTAYRLPDSEFDVQVLFAYKNNKSYQDWFLKERGAFVAGQQKTKKK
jgi:hypothetical protein